MQRVREREVREVREVREEGNGNTTPGCGVLRDSHLRRFAASGGFTLTEVLIVAVIIGILLALVSTAVFPALDTAKEFARYSEAANLSMAMESFKAQYGATPPSDLSNPSDSSSAVRKFVARAFPRYDAESKLVSDFSTENINAANDPGHALVVWLVGFSGDPANPFSGHSTRMQEGGGTGNSDPFYEFDSERIGAGDGTGVRYFPNLPGGVSTGTNKTKAFLYFTSPWTNSDFNPYKKSLTGYYNPRGFQIIQAGLDGKLGTGGELFYPVSDDGKPSCDCGLDENRKIGDPCDADRDNIANFASGTIGDFYDKNSN